MATKSPKPPKSKVKQFDELVAIMNSRGDKWFTKEELNDQFHTTVYHAHLEMNDLKLPIFVVIDDTAFSFIRIGVTLQGVEEQQIPAVLAHINGLNQRFKISKYYISDQDHNVYIDISVPSTEFDFNAGIIPDLLKNVIVPHLKDTHKSLFDVVKGGN